MTCLSSVVFPEPFGPVRAIDSPSRMSRSMSCRTCLFSVGEGECPYRSDDLPVCDGGVGDTLVGPIWEKSVDYQGWRRASKAIRRVTRPERHMCDRIGNGQKTFEPVLGENDGQIYREIC